MGIERRARRQQERDRKKMIEKIHRETMERFKHMTEDEIKAEITAFQQAYGNYNQSNQETIPGMEILDGF